MSGEPATRGLTSGPLAPGLYHFMRLEGDAPTRFHLRVDPDGGGLLLANASEAAYLSPSGVLMAYGLLSGLDEAAIVAQVGTQFRGVRSAQVMDDLRRVRRLLDDLASPDASYPVTNLGEAEGPEGRRLAAPLQADLDLGDPGQVRPILERLWNVGVPQVTFLAQPGADGNTIVAAIEGAEDIGMIAGLRGLASWFTEETLHRAALAGLDYLMLVLASGDEEEHDTLVGAADHGLVLRAFQLCQEWELCPVAQVPLTDETAHELDLTVAFACDRGVRDFSFFALSCPDDDELADRAGAVPARAMAQVATLVTEAADEAGARFIWAPPMRFDPGKSVPQHLARGPRTSAELAIRVQPDGSVFPSRGKRICTGNLLTQRWEEIWNSDCFRRYRQGVPVQRCSVCPGLPVCGAGCPKDPASWSDDIEEAQA